MIVRFLYIFFFFSGSKSLILKEKERKSKKDKGKIKPNIFRLIDRWAGRDPEKENKEGDIKVQR